MLYKSPPKQKHSFGTNAHFMYVFCVLVKCFFEKIYSLTQGYHDIEQECFLSLPVVLGANGVSEVVQQKLEDQEKESLHKSASLMGEVQLGLTF